VNLDGCAGPQLLEGAWRDIPLSPTLAERLRRLQDEIQQIELVREARIQKFLGMVEVILESAGVDQADVLGSYRVEGDILRCLVRSHGEKAE
jgi:hypothetical protein